MATEIPVTYRGQVVGHALVDDRMAPRLGSYRWNLTADGYARRSESVYDERGRRTGTRTIYMHREVPKLAPGNPCQAHHRNEDRLDNRRNNLQVVTADKNRRSQGLRRNGNRDKLRHVQALRKAGLIP